jgi:hypothetical protein
MKESIESYKTKNKELYSAVKQMNNKLEESMLSNAKLIYSNRILGDASLNERQKDKIVEAIAKQKQKMKQSLFVRLLKLQWDLPKMMVQNHLASLSTESLIYLIFCKDQKEISTRHKNILSLIE